MNYAQYVFEKQITNSNDGTKNRSLSTFLSSKNEIQCSSSSPRTLEKVVLLRSLTWSDACMKFIVHMLNRISNYMK